MWSSSRKLVIALLCLLGAMMQQHSVEGQSSAPRPTPSQLAWQEAELGVVFHYDLHVFDGKPYQQGRNRITPIADYNIFNPTHLDTDQWIRSAKAAGATFAILTATHETGFALYPSDVNPYSVKALRWKDGKGDIVGDFIASCRKYGVKPGIYLGIRWNAFMGVHDFKVQGTDSVFTRNRQMYYNKMVEGMVEELCTRYGPLFEFWFDGGASNPGTGAPDVLPIVSRLQPDCLFYWNSQRADARWGGSETGTVGYPCWATFPYSSTDLQRHPDIADQNFAILKHGDSAGTYWMPAMADAPLRGKNGRHEWFWEPGDEAHVYEVDDLLKMYDQSVGRNSTLILGLTPDTTGRLPQIDSTVLADFGKENERRFGRPVLQTSGTGSRVELATTRNVKVNRLVLQEDIREGERIRSYRLMVKKGNQWEELCKGSSVGHKRIQDFPAVSGKAFRLEVERSNGMALLKNVSLYYTDSNRE